MPDPTAYNATQWRDMILRNASNRNDDIDVGEGSYPYVIASAVGEMLAIDSANAVAIARKIPLKDLTEEETRAQYGDLCPRQLESKSTGYVIMDAAGSSTIQPGDRLTDPDTKQIFETTNATATAYATGDLVPVSSVDYGSGTIVAAGKKLNWSVLRPGCYAMAEVSESVDGTGIYGGRAKETLDEWKARISDMLANPASHGNEADILALLKDSTGRTLSNGAKTTGHGLAVAKGFCYPALLGPGTCGITALMKTDQWWKSRAPSALELSALYQYAVNGMAPSGFPGDFSLLPMTVVDASTSVAVSVELDTTGAGWNDFAPWPTYGAGTARKVIAASPATTATSFRISKASGVYTGETQPSPGTTIGLLDRTTGKMVRKTILTVSGTGPWDITVNAGSGLSDTSYVPIAGQSVSPWSDALQGIVDEIGKQVATTGVGEAVEYPPGDGKRQVRCPAPTATKWPQNIGSRIANGIPAAVSSVAGATFLETIPYSTLAVGAPDLVYAFLLTDVGIYKS